MANFISLPVFALAMFFSTIASGQQQETLARFIISDAKMNDTDITPEVLANKAFIVFYKGGTHGQLFMANVWPVADTQSHGPIYAIESRSTKETYDSYAADVFHFNWRYQNTYDTNKGTATVQVIKIYKPQGVAFVIKIIPEDLDVLVYKGYMDGSLDRSFF